MVVDGEYWVIEHDRTYPESKRVLFKKDKMSQNTAVLYLTEAGAKSAIKLTRYAPNARIVRVRIEEVND